MVARYTRRLFPLIALIGCIALTSRAQVLPSVISVSNANALSNALPYGTYPSYTQSASNFVVTSFDLILQDLSVTILAGGVKSTGSYWGCRQFASLIGVNLTAPNGVVFNLIPYSPYYCASCGPSSGGSTLSWCCKDPQFTNFEIISSTTFAGGGNGSLMSPALPLYGSMSGICPQNYSGGGCFRSSALTGVNAPTGNFSSICTVGYDIANNGGKWTLTTYNGDYYNYDGCVTGWNDWTGPTFTINKWQANFKGVYAYASVPAQYQTIFVTTLCDIGDSAFAPIAIKNIGGYPLKINGIQAGTPTLTAEYTAMVSPPGVPTRTFPITIAPGAYDTVWVRFTPTAFGTRLDQLILLTNGVNYNSSPVTAQQIIVGLQGTGQAALIEGRDPLFYYHTKVLCRDDSTQWAKVKSVGNRTLVISRVIIRNFVDPNGNTTTGASDYKVVIPATYSILDPKGGSHANDSIGITFRPKAPGHRFAQMVIVSNARTINTPPIASADSIYLTLFGEGIAPIMQATVPNFGSVPVGSSVTGDLWIKNVGDGNFKTYAQSVSSGDIRAFSITKPLPALIKPGDSAFMEITFAPYTQGFSFARILLNNNSYTKDSIKQFDLQGIGVPVAIATMNPTTIDFGTIDIGAPPPSKKFTIISTGGIDLVISGTTFSAPTEYTAGIIPHTVKTGSTDSTLLVTFKPLVPGTHRDTASFISNNVSPLPPVLMRANACLRTLAATPVALFSGQVVDTGSTASASLCFKNAGNCVVTVDSQHIEGLDAGLYTLKTPFPSTILPGDSVCATIDFKPLARFDNATNAALVLKTNSWPDNHQAKVPLSGRGGEYCTQGSVDHFDLFGDVTTPPGQVVDTKTYYIQNCGDIDVSVQASLTGADPDEFAFSPSAGFALPAHTTDSVVVTFKPRTGGIKSAVLKVTTTNPHNPTPSAIQLNGYPALGAVDDPGSVPTAYWLGQNYPNPFNPTTSIAFDIARAGQVRMEILNELGQVVATLASDSRSAGSYSVTFDATSLPSGLYYYRLRSGTFTATKVMQLTK
jgi:hypothetical protein